MNVIRLVIVPLAVLHRNGSVPCDMNLENILVDESGVNDGTRGGAGSRYEIVRLADLSRSFLFIVYDNGSENKHENDR